MNHQLCEYELKGREALVALEWVITSFKKIFLPPFLHCCPADRCAPGSARGSAAGSREEAGAAEERPQERDEQHKREISRRGQGAFQI